MMTETLPKLRKTRDALPPNLYSGAFLLSAHLGVERKSFITIYETMNERVKVYTRDGKFYTVPLVDKMPPDGYNWHLLGRFHSRDMYVATTRRLY